MLHNSITKLFASSDHSRIETVEVTHAITGEKQYLAVDEIVINHGYERDIALLENSPVPIEVANGSFIEGSVNSETSVLGIFAAGDIVNYPHLRDA